jgi:HSP20 family protein
MANRELTPRTSGYSSRGTGLTSFGGVDPFASFRREMDRLFDDFFTPAEPRSFAAQGGGSGRGLGVWPSLEVSETEQAYTVSAELPGLDPKDVQIELRDNALTISGEKRSERNEEDGGRRYSERSFGRFERTVPLEAEVDADKVEASCQNGVLKITLPKNAQARDKTRRIEIKGRDGAGGSASAATGSGQ